MDLRTYSSITVIILSPAAKLTLNTYEVKYYMEKEMGFFRGLFIGILLSIPLWALIIFILSASYKLLTH